MDSGDGGERGKSRRREGSPRATKGPTDPEEVGARHESRRGPQGATEGRGPMGGGRGWLEAQVKQRPSREGGWSKGGGQGRQGTAA